MSNNCNSISDTLLCRLKFTGLLDCKLDDSYNLIYVGKVLSKTVVIPSGIKGLRGTCLSGLDFEVLKLDKGLEVIELCSLSNCSNFREIYVYEHQLELITELHRLYPDLLVCIRRSVL